MTTVVHVRDGYDVYIGRGNVVGQKHQKTVGDLKPGEVVTIEA